MAEQLGARIGFVIPAPVLAVAPWRARRSPAGLAGAVTRVRFVALAFRRQAFANYYYFTIATACWAIAAAKLPMNAAGVREKSAGAAAH